MRIIILLLTLNCFVACKEQPQKQTVSSTPTKDSLSTPTPLPPEEHKNINPDSIPLQQKWIDLGEVAPEIQQDIRYATSNNFIGRQIYDCGRCLLRPEVTQALLRVHHQLKTKGYGLKLFDCYRPKPIQQKLWDVKPDRRYVTPPEKGSMHNRGAAVDLTLVNSKGKELNMGTDFDSFERKAWHDFKDLPKATIEHRKLLKSTMEAYGFKSIKTEWWHYSYTKKMGYSLESDLWDCD